MNYPKEPIKIRTTEQNMEKLLKAIRIGTPLHIALVYARISKVDHEYYLKVAEQFRKAEEANLFNVNILQSTIEERCQELGIDLELVMNVRAKKDYASACVEFIDSIEEAKAECIVRNLERLEVKEKFSNWQASAWLLERRCPEDFGKKEDKDEEAKVESLRVDFIDPKSQEDRLERMEKEISDETAR